ncbi:hypothetical protein AAG570_001224 [Ranatra chinensis]|uniref:limulus clotting factor C n=1 Tax=Ranatra chinensis TaxID=642074 RepID=A0ABD0YB92_9HEMI
MKPSVFSAESAEVDSSEHGLVEGEKKTTCPCGWSNKESGRIVGGEETKINEFPFAVALIDREKRFQFCGGAIVTQYHVLTAAHCTDNYLYFGRKISVLVGDHDITKHDTESSRLIHVDKIVQHSGFEFAFYKYDISLLVLSEKIEFSRFVGPVCLSHSRLNLEKKYVRILGWGKTSMEGPSSPVLKKVDLRIVPLEVCSRHFLHLIPAERKHICTLGTKKGACNGDSGGPVIWLDPETNRYTLVGLVSFGKVCGGPEPTVHTDVTSYWPWIDYYIKGEHKCRPNLTLLY